MRNTSDEDGPETGLHLYWDDARPGEEANTGWGQLAGGMQRLVAVTDDVQAAAKGRGIWLRAGTKVGYGR